jgi:uncharacterized membrane protein
MHLLFWLSLIPFATGWMGENHFSTWLVAIHLGVVLLTASIAYFIFVKVLLYHDNHNSKSSKALGNDEKGLVSTIIYLSAILLSVVHPYISCSLYIVVALIWLAPDKRIERQLKTE